VKLAGNNVSAEVEEAELPKAKVGDLEVYSVKACHSIYAVAYVVTDGRRRVLYSGDTTEPCETILEEARDADLVVQGTELEFVIMVIAVSCVKLLSAHNSTQHTSRKHKV